MENYEKEATDLLKKLGVKFTTSFITHDKHFIEDTDTRDIYRVTFSRGKKRFSLRFGQSLNNTGTHPNSYDVISCLQKSDVGTFENFCAEFGCDTDSRKAEKTYKAVRKEWQKVDMFFTAEEIEQLQEIQ